MTYKRKLITYLTAGWCVVFGTVHVLWLFGYYLGLPSQQATQAFNRSWFWYYNFFAAAACFAGAFITLKLSSSVLELKRNRFVFIACWAYTILLFVRAMGGLVQFIHMAIKGTIVLNWFLFWDAWFCVGCILFFFTVFYSSRRAHSSKWLDNF